MANHNQIENVFSAQPPYEPREPQTNPVPPEPVEAVADPAIPTEQERLVSSLLKPGSDRAIHLVGSILFGRDRHHHFIRGRHIGAQAMRGGPSLRY